MGDSANATYEDGFWILTRAWLSVLAFAVVYVEMLLLLSLSSLYEETQANL